MELLVIAERWLEMANRSSENDAPVAAAAASSGSLSHFVHEVRSMCCLLVRNRSANAR
jgi:hypothetical protein